MINGRNQALYSFTPGWYFNLDMFGYREWPASFVVDVLRNVAGSGVATVTEGVIGAVIAAEVSTVRTVRGV
jgi:hypothetical protein